MVKLINSIIQRILSVKVIRKTLNTSLFLFYALWSISGFLSSFFYLIKGSFRREERAVISGLFHYYKSFNKNGAPLAFLRRNIHRIEKGLIMRPIKPVFGKNYIEETVEAYKKIIEKKDTCPEIIDDTTMQWFNAVLEKYFNTVYKDSAIVKARLRYKTIKFPSQTTLSTPVKRNDAPLLTTDYESFLRLATRRRSIRWFLNKRVERDLIDKAIEVAKLAPSACNRLPYEFRLYDDPQQVRKISQIPMGTEGFSQNIPVLCVIIGRLDYFMSERDRHVPYIDASLAAMQFMLALETLGLASCPLNWPDFFLLEMKMKRALSLKTYERPILLIALGYPDPQGLIPISLKKSIDSMRFWNKG